MVSTSFKTANSSITWQGAGETIHVEAWGPNSVRVRATHRGELDDTSWALLPADTSHGRVEVDGETARLINGEITVELRSQVQFDFQAGYIEPRCHISFLDSEGAILLEEIDAGGALKLKARDIRPHPNGDASVTVAFAADPAERLYGMGQYQQRVLNLKGSTLELAHRNSQVTVPFVLSDKGYGLLWHNPAIGRATFGLNRTEWTAASTQQIDYWVTAAKTPAEILTAYADATGHVPVMPEYGLGFWQSKMRYWNQEQLLTVAREYQSRGIPLDLIVADFFHWPQMGDYRFEEEFWPNPEAMVNELRKMGTELMVSVWPQVSVESENFAEMAAHNYLVRADRGMQGQMSFQGPSVFFDATNPDARRFLWETLERNYGSHGIGLFWLDEAEPEFAAYDYDHYRYHAGSVAQIGNIYPQHFARTIFEGKQADRSSEVVTLVRAAWAGSQRYGALVWSGDVHSTWEDLARQVVAGIHMGIAGIPWVTTDIGGFADGNPTDPAFQELLVRWFQFGAFSPVMRLHGDRLPPTPVTASDGSSRMSTGADNEIWSFGEDAYRILRSYIDLRNRLRPYIRQTHEEAHTTGLPIMRALFIGFPNDPLAWDINDEYLFGAHVLVAPVLQPGVTSRTVYLPADATWTDLWTGETFAGGQALTASAPLERIPVFLKESAAKYAPTAPPSSQ